MTIELNTAALPDIGDAVARPPYDRAALSPGMVHIGIGNFHRAHQAVYLDRLFAMGLDHDWAITGAGTRPADAAMRDDLAGQDWLTTVVELDPDGFSARIIGSMTGFAEPTPAAVVEAMVDPAIRIVSLTVTEGGYFIDATTGGFDTGHADVTADITAPDSPRTVFGMIVAALSKRREGGIAPFTVMSCDNLPGNGHVAQQAVVGLATEISPELGAWIDGNVTFPNGMVDCITPATGNRERALVTERFGIVDARPVVCEPFRQWVLEDRFVAGRPALEEVGVTFVEDVAPYELMKLRILNGGHAAIAYPAALLGIDMVHEAMADAQVAGFLRKLHHDEVVPVVPPIPGVDFGAYVDTICTRFSNAAVGDTIPRLCQDGSSRQPKFILPTIADRIAAGLAFPGLALEVALWCRYLHGTDETGAQIVIDDPIAADLQAAARAAKDDPGAFLELDTVFGPLAGEAAFHEAFADASNALWRDGVRTTLAAYAGDAT